MPFPRYLLLYRMKEDGGDYWRQVYIVPWCRVGCWAVGMLLGLLVYKRGRKPLRNKVNAFFFQNIESNDLSNMN